MSLVTKSPNGKILFSMEFFDLSIVLPIVVAAVAGGLIGIEREYRDKSAGFRTMILIAVGSALFTSMSLLLGKGDESTRIAAAIVTGVGFMGAGVILKDGANIKGLTTAATIWLVASLGMAAAAEEYWFVIVVTTLSLIVLWLFPPFERWLDKLHEFIEITVTVKNTDAAEDDVLDIFDELGIKVVEVRRKRLDKAERTMIVKAKLTPGKRKALSEILVNEKGVLAFEA
jgi:putative Mg2+ transporter-C (MgtC) family protein